MNAVLVCTLSAVVALLTGAEAAFMTDCARLKRQIAQKEARIFVDVDTPLNNGNMVNQTCFETFFDQNGLQRFVFATYYYCQVGFVAFLPQVDTPESINNADFSAVTDLAALAEELNVTKIFVVCVKVPAPATTPPPTPAPVNIGSCPSGPTRVNQYLRRDQGKLCRQSCSFGVRAHGASIGSRSRTIYRCCSGQPRLVSRASRIYSCS